MSQLIQMLYTFAPIYLFLGIMGIILSIFASVAHETMKPFLFSIPLLLLTALPGLYFASIESGDVIYGSTYITTDYVKQMNCSELLNAYNNREYFGVGDDFILKEIVVKGCR